MKNKFFVVLVMVALMASMLPAAALAKAATPVRLNVYNHTGEEAQITATNAGGVWNLNVTKSIDIRCKRDGGVDAFYRVQEKSGSCGVMGVYMLYSHEGPEWFAPSGLYFKDATGYSEAEINAYIASMTITANNDTQYN